jgi:hypothetical protein
MELMAFIAEAAVEKRILDHRGLASSARGATLAEPPRRLATSGSRKTKL